MEGFHGITMVVIGRLQDLRARARGRVVSVSLAKVKSWCVVQKRSGGAIEGIHLKFFMIIPRIVATIFPVMMGWFCSSRTLWGMTLLITGV